MLRHDTGERHGQVVAEGQVHFPRRLVLSATQHLENELVAFLAVLAGQRVDVLERRRFQRLEPIPPVGLLDDPDDVLAPPEVLGKEIAHATRGPGLFCHQPATQTTPDEERIARL